MAGAFVLGLVLPAVASGAPKVPSTLELQGYDSETFILSGVVSSETGKCEKGRTVSFSDGGPPLASTKTGKNGAFEINIVEIGPTVEDGFDAKVKPRKVGRGSKRKACKGDSAAARVETHGITFQSIDLNPATITLFGSVSSTLPECAAGRKLQVWSIFEGNRSYISITTTDGNAQWEFQFSNLLEGGYDVTTTEDPVYIAAPQSNGDLILATCQPANPIDSDDVTVVEDNPSISITHDGQLFAFFGNLSSDVPGCLAGRTVDLYDGDTLVGSSPVNETTGAWSVSGDANSGHSYTAEVNQITVVGASQPYTACQDVQSGPYEVP